MAQWLQVSKSGYYAWRRRSTSLKEQENQVLLDEIRRVHEESHGGYGSRKTCRRLNETSAAPVNHKRVERIMRENDIRSKTRRKYKATTNSRHNLPVAENILNRDCTANAPGQKMVSDITYLPTDEGWLYLASVYMAGDGSFQCNYCMKGKSFIIIIHLDIPLVFLYCFADTFYSESMFFLVCLVGYKQMRS